MRHIPSPLTIFGIPPRRTRYVTDSFKIFVRSSRSFAFQSKPKDRVTRTRSVVLSLLSPSLLFLCLSLSSPLFPFSSTHSLFSLSVFFFSLFSLYLVFFFLFFTFFLSLSSFFLSLVSHNATSCLTSQDLFCPFSFSSVGKRGRCVREKEKRVVCEKERMRGVNERFCVKSN